MSLSMRRSVSSAVTRIASAAVSVALMIGVASCNGAAGNAQSPAAGKFQGVLRYYPLEKGFQWSFFVRDAVEGGPGLLAVTRVVQFDGKVALLSTGKELTTLRVESDGLVRVDSGAYLLVWPTSVGAKWQGAKGAIVEVTQMDEKVQVEAGSFEGCLETTETFRGDEAKIVVTTFCPDVGPVKLDVRETNTPPGEVPAQAIATLRSFGPAVDLGAK